MSTIAAGIAGRCVAARAIGLVPRYASTVDRQVKFYGGATPIDEALIVCCGAAAEARFRGEPFTSFTSGRELNSIRQILRRHRAPADYMEGLMRRAARIIKDNWPAVERLAAALLATDEPLGEARIRRETN